ncbi:hypothetical protein H7U37_13815 [Pseudoflavonifractor phocaeensis]|uniref:hypothetical protein n=1 Tax=Pseudoflavonifractor phocaeensis TaxID=1870988 RepID=UPI00195BBB7F|nr:hypothetical protein [Pseudoflavonifractor phocaeensis]MBM6939584.1 hypothetical protein [Pseudoflavonifractor phocaeensis]
MPAKINHYDAVLRICVDECRVGSIQGRVFSRRLTAPLTFSDVGDLLLQLEEIFDRQNFPQAFERKRTFGDGWEPMDLPLAPSLAEGMAPEAVAEAAGQVTTFELYVITRRNTTWQGFVDWLDGSPRSDYQSVLALLKLIDRHLLPFVQGRRH